MVRLTSRSAKSGRPWEYEMCWAVSDIIRSASFAPSKDLAPDGRSPGSRSLWRFGLSSRCGGAHKAPPRPFVAAGRKTPPPPTGGKKHHKYFVFSPEQPARGGGGWGRTEKSGRPRRGLGGGGGVFW